MGQTSADAVSVKHFLEQVKARIEPPFGDVWVQGEVGDLSTSHGSGHMYFSLKEAGASLKCAIWAGKQRFLKFLPRNGDRVQVRGGLSLYVPGGTLTFSVSQCEKAGIGDLLVRLKELEAKLRAEKLFDRPRKPLPLWPKRIGVVAALGGAALRDVLKVTARRAPGIHVLIHPASAQGDRCPMENLQALLELQDPHWGCEVILLVRGGGSAEDLWGFNDPDLVRVVAGSCVPVVTGVGHEIDRTLVDLAAEVSAATPSQAAELATPDIPRFQAELHRRWEGLIRAIDRRLHSQESTLNQLVDSHGMNLLEGRLRETHLKLDYLRHRLVRFGLVSPQFAGLDNRLRQMDPEKRLLWAQERHRNLVINLKQAAQRLMREEDRLRIQQARRQLLGQMEVQLQEGKTFLAQGIRRLQLYMGDRTQRLAHLSGRLENLDPRAPLRRGFVLVRNQQGALVVSARDVQLGDPLDLQWSDGQHKVKVQASSQHGLPQPVARYLAFRSRRPRRLAKR